MALFKKEKQDEEVVVSRPPMGFEVIKREFSRDPLAIFSIIVLLGILAFVFVVPHFMPSDAGSVVDIFNRYSKPGENGFLLGSDDGGRDVLAQLIIGTRNSLTIGWSVTIITEIVAIALGLFSGYYGGKIDDIMMRIIDFILILPTLLLIIVIVTVMKTFDMWSLILILSALGWAGSVRFYRTYTLSEASKEYVKASKVMGTYDWKIMFKEVLPNLSSIIITSFTLGLASSIGLETGLSFLGFGLPSGTPSLGTLLSAARNADVIENKQWVWLPALVVTMIMMLSISYIGQAFKRAFSVKQRLG